MFEVEVRDRTNGRSSKDSERKISVIPGEKKVLEWSNYE